MKLRSMVITCCIFLVVTTTACRNDPESAERISLDFPCGESRLLVAKDEPARLFYAALPESLAVQSGTFDLDVLMGQLSSRIHDVVTGDQVAGRSFGTVTITYSDGSLKDYFLYDGEFAEALFVTACRNVAPGSGDSSILFEMVCGERVNGTGGSI